MSSVHVLFLFPIAIYNVFAYTIASTGTSVLSNATLPFSIATIYDKEPISVLPSGDGVVIKSSSTIRLDTANSAHATEAFYTLSDSRTIDVVRQSSGIVVGPAQISSTLIPTQRVPSGSAPSNPSGSFGPWNTTTSDIFSNPSTVSSLAGTTQLLATGFSSGSTGGSNFESKSSRSLVGISSTIRSSDSASISSHRPSIDSTFSSLLTVPLSTGIGGSTISSGSSPDTTGSTSHSSSLNVLTFGTPSSTIATAFHSSITETVSELAHGSFSSPITLQPVTTTIASSQATSDVSSVSSELVGLLPVISSWKANPTPLKSDTLTKVKSVKNDVEDLLSKLGHDDSSSGCDSKRKRGLIGTISDIVSGLSCIDEDLDNITDNINIDDVDGIDDSLDKLRTETDDLTDDDNNNSRTNSNSGSSTSVPTSSPLSSSCTSFNTAFEVTVECVPTSFHTSGITVLTTACSPSTTAIASGCSVTGTTTTITASTSASESQTACASDTCGDSCPMHGGPLSGAAMGIVASTEDCASISTRFSSILPTASYGIARSTAIASPSLESTAAVPSRRSFLINPMADDEELVVRSMIERALPDVIPPYAAYVSNLNPEWISQGGDASGQFFPYPPSGHSAAGVNGLYGCTSVIISSEKGVYISHIWENPVFIIGDFVATDDNTFRSKGFEALRDGTATAQSITALIGTDQRPGPLNTIYSPKVFVLTPRTSVLDQSQYGITTTLRYESRARQLAQEVVQIVPGSGETGFLIGYVRTNRQLSTQVPGTAGRAILEVDPFQYWLTNANTPANSPGLQVGRWRLWVEDQLITDQDFWTPHTTPPVGIQRRDFGYVNPCVSSGSISISSSSDLSATSPSTFKRPTDTFITILTSPSTLQGSSTPPSTLISSTPFPTLQVSSTPLSSLQTSSTLPQTTIGPTSIAFTCTSNPSPKDPQYPCECNDGWTYCTTAGPCTALTTAPPGENCCMDCM